MEPVADDYLAEIVRWRTWARAILGIGVIWKDHERHLQHELPMETRTKSHPACLAVKGQPVARACLHDCELRRDWWRRDGGHPFVFTCHAGLREYRVPVLVDDELIGVWMLGPVRPAANGRRPASLPREAWAALAVDFPPQVEIVARMLASHFTSLHAARERHVQLAKAATAKHPGIRRALAIIDQEASARLRAADVARRVGLSSPQFSVAFKRITGSTFSDFVEQRVMRHATRLLLDGDPPLRSIADRLGFGSPSYFTRAFKRHHGITPSAYRQRLLDPPRV